MPKIGNAPPSFGSAPQGTAHQRVTPGRKRATLLRLCRYVMRFRFRVILALLLTVLSNYFGLMGPYLSGLAVDSIGSEAGAVQFPLVFRCCLFMALFYVASALLSYLLSMIMITISRKVTYQMRSDIFNKLSSLPVGYFDTHQAGDIISRISYDTDTINSSLSTDLVQVLACGRVSGNDDRHLSPAGAGVPHHRSPVHLHHPVHHLPHPSPVPAAFSQDRPAQRLHRGKHHRSENPPVLLSGRAHH